MHNGPILNALPVPMLRQVCLFWCSRRGESITFEKLGPQFLDTILGSILESLGVPFGMLLGCFFEVVGAVWGSFGLPHGIKIEALAIFFQEWSQRGSSRDI